MAGWKKAAALAVGVCAILGGVALAQSAAPGTPPSWDVLVRCAEIGGHDERLDCYDAAMKAAGYAPKPEAVTAARKKTFGLRAPQISILKHKEKPAEAAAAAPAEAAQAAAPEKAKQKARKAQAAPKPAEDENNVSLTLAKVARQGNGRLLMITDDGQIWEQTDDVPVGSLPKDGAPMAVHRGKFGGYFCDVTKSLSVRCSRVR